LEFIALHYGKDLSEKVKEFLTEKNLTWAIRILSNQ
jgi:hypothetical protein